MSILGSTDRELRDPAPAAAPPDPGTVLVVDDEESIRTLAGMMLERSGYRPLTAAGGREAVEVIRSRPGEIDLVLLDLSMPVMDGAETLQAIRAIDARIAVLLSSGRPGDDDAGRGDRSVSFIQKP